MIGFHVIPGLPRKSLALTALRPSDLTLQTHSYNTVVSGFSRAAQLRAGRKRVSASSFAAFATRNLDPTTTLNQHQANVEPGQLTSTVLLNVVEACLHCSTPEWIFLRKLRVGFHGNAAQRLDAYALNLRGSLAGLVAL